VKNERQKLILPYTPITSITPITPNTPNTSITPITSSWIQPHLNPVVAPKIDVTLIKRQKLIPKVSTKEQ
jgi:hypothetical protein